MPNTKNVHQKLQELRVALQQKNLKKSGKNKHIGYKYYELYDFIPTVNELMLEMKLTSNISYGTKMAKLDVINLENIAEVMTFTTPMSSADLKGCHEVQNLGAVQTYLRRYLWTTALEITESDSLEAQTGKKEKTSDTKEKTSDTKEKTSDTEELTMRAIASAKDNEKLDKLISKIDSSEKLTKEQKEKLKAKIEAKKQEEPVYCHGVSKNGCEEGSVITEQERQYSEKMHGKPLCRDCQNKLKQV